MIDVDVLIVGSGPVGATCARLLVDDGQLNVLMVDAGPLLTQRAGQHVRNLAEQPRLEAQVAAQGPTAFRYSVPSMPERANAAVSGDYRLEHLVRPGTHLPNGERWGDLPAAACSTNVGGMGAHWTCACPPPAEGEAISFIPAAQMQAALAKARELLQVTAAAYPDTPVSQRLRERLGSAFADVTTATRAVQRMPLACSSDNTQRRWSGSDTILGTLAEPSGRPERFEIRHDTACLQLRVKHDRIVGADLLDRASGTRYQVDAKTVIVAADALRTPQLLWASGIRPEALGRYLNDQPQVVHAVRLDADECGISQSGADPTVGVYWVPYDRQHHPFHGQVMQMEACPVALADEAQADVEHIVAMGWFCCKQDIRAQDRVHFSETEKDFLGLPAMTLDYSLTDRDLEQVGKARDLLQRAGKALGTPLGEAPLMLPPGSSLHYQGTTRMGEADDGTSVCDDHGQVWRFHNLYVAGNGVIPTPTACNPTLTSVALAVRTCERILQERRP
ncbi:GMC oxidoreductase [Pantoea sp. Ap-967]|uniref:GMC oxidoreductase n=1 Tax=Pantoea sp. Ap-967 TaxID=2608362 RepID=UPI0019664CF0|nr:GMC oxidoreductase [Pantoea sp. Ap-967]